MTSPTSPQSDLEENSNKMPPRKQVQQSLANAIQEVAEAPQVAAPAPTPPEPKQAPQKPSVGRVVHYTTDPSGKARAAIITEAFEGDSFVNLVVFNSSGALPLMDIEFAEVATPGCWSWPPRT